MVTSRALGFAMSIETGRNTAIWDESLQAADLCFPGALKDEESRLVSTLFRLPYGSGGRTPAGIGG